MHVQVSYQDLDNTPWVDQFITSRVSKLERYLVPSASVEVHIKFFKNRYYTTLAIHNGHHYAFSAEADNLYASFSEAIDKASRSLREHKRKIKDKINRRYISLKEFAA